MKDKVSSNLGEIPNPFKVHDHLFDSVTDSTLAVKAILRGVDLNYWGVIEKERFFYNSPYSNKFIQKSQHISLRLVSPPPITGDISDQAIIKEIILNISKMK